MIKKENIDKYKKILETERGRLVGEIKKESTPKNFGDDIDGFDTEADEAENLVNELSVGGSFRERVEEIDAALNRIEMGTYGTCLGCNGSIEEIILASVPESRLCMSCKKSS